MQHCLKMLVLDLTQMKPVKCEVLHLMMIRKQNVENGFAHIKNLTINHLHLNKNLGKFSVSENC